MGSYFLLILTLNLLSQNAIAQGGKILLPDPVDAKPPPTRSQEEIDEDYRRKKKHMDKKLDRKEKKEEPSFTLDKKLLKETLKPTPMKVSLNLHLNYNVITTFGDDRQNYDAEPSVNLMALYRPGENNDNGNINMWLGFRSYTVQGTGSYKGNNGRYSFTYFGPTIGVGKFDPPAGDVGKKAFATPESVNAALGGRSGLFAFAGIAAQSRQGTHEPEEDPPDEDLNTKAIDFDAPGVWFEVWYVYLKYNALSINVQAGAQSGASKIFYYVGIGTGGWR